RAAFPFLTRLPHFSTGSGRATSAQSLGGRRVAYSDPTVGSRHTTGRRDVTRKRSAASSGAISTIASEAGPASSSAPPPSGVGPAAGTSWAERAEANLTLLRDALIALKQGDLGVRLPAS